MRTILSATSHSLFQEQTLDRGKRERTRSALLDSAISVFASKGFEATRITDITEHAGVANGTFYNYYRDKQEILNDVAIGLAVEIVRRINDELADTINAIVRVVTATARVLEVARQEPEWIDVLLSSIPIVPELQSQVVRYLRQDLQMGLEQGYFHIEVDLLLVNQMLALLSTAILLDRKISKETTRRTCEAHLRLLGLPPVRAARQVEKALSGLQ
ncbi:MAG: TetR/AcrR family transcriptional regulator [Pseudomonadales bacterium]